MINRLEEYKKRLDAYYAEELRILNSAQSYTIGSRNLIRVSLDIVNKKIDDMIDKIAKEESRIAGRGTHRVMGVIPRDV